MVISAGRCPIPPRPVTPDQEHQTTRPPTPRPFPCPHSLVRKCLARNTAHATRRGGSLFFRLPARQASDVGPRHEGPQEKPGGPSPATTAEGGKRSPSDTHLMPGRNSPICLSLWGDCVRPDFWNETGGRGYYILSYYTGVPLGLTVILVGLFYLARQKTTLALLITLALAVGVSIPLYLFRRLALHSTWDPAQKFLVWTVGLGLALVVFFAGISLYNLLRLRTQQRRYQVLLRLHADRGWIASGSREG